MNTKQTIIEVEGMTCSSCVGHVEAALRKLPGIRALKVSLENGNVVVEHDDTSPPIEAMIDALGEAGYDRASCETTSKRPASAASVSAKASA